ncbi:conserved hypothetical protein [Vibrio chagasii]|nr:conserved hypothetical protein [Vibrio chagasii]
MLYVKYLLISPLISTDTVNTHAVSYKMQHQATQPVEKSKAQKNDLGGAMIPNSSKRKPNKSGKKASKKVRKIPLSFT